jgi:N-acetylneuraminate synthase
MTVKPVQVGSYAIGPGHPCFIVAEIGINHNGSLETALRLIDAAADAGCQAVKFQKRTVDLVYAAEDLARPRESPFGATNGDLKRGLELGEAEYRAIDAYCRDKGILWFASSWDEASLEFMEAFDPPCHKIASACLTHHDLLRRHRATGRPLLLSTGMSTMEEICRAVELLGRDRLVILHTTSTYPSRVEDLNLRVIHALRDRFGCPTGYSGHEVEPHGFTRLVRDIRSVELALGDGVKRVVEDEIPVMQKLRRTPSTASRG